MTLRAIRILREVDIVAAEDTRVTRKLLSHYDIHPPELLSYRDDNERTAGPLLVGRLQAGKSVAFVSDAGLPGISDPGSLLAERARGAGVAIEVVPGPSSVLAGLVISGMGGGPFVFEGFLPRQRTARDRRLLALEGETRPTVLFESPQRVLATLRELAPRLGDRPVSVSREMTKLFEETRRGTAEELAQHFEAHEPRGEFVLVVAGGTPRKATPEELDLVLRRCMADGLGSREAAATAVEELGVVRKEAYQRYLVLREEECVE
jgi:16S rRNA (cytidine1402-2'-O)-methyltransferase